MQDMIQNYHERLVFDHLRDLVRAGEIEANEDYVADIACIALNQLSPRYVRHSIDTTFYMTTEDLSRTMVNVRTAVNQSIRFLEKRRDQRPDGSSMSQIIQSSTEEPILVKNVER